VAIFITALVSFGQDKDTKKDKPKLLAVGEVAPEWKLNDATGKTHTLSDYRGKVVVMDFWATWCEPCKEVMPRMQKLYETYQDKDVVVLGVNSWEKKDPVAFMGKKRFAYPLLLKGEEIAESYRVTTLPSVYVVGVDGRIIYSFEGVDHKDLARLIQKYLKENAANVRSTAQ
jgi:cytochrome c biogenesis protein CcmG, thiol:disulfide interchange protein DsbE